MADSGSTKKQAGNNWKQTVLPQHDLLGVNKQTCLFQYVVFRCYCFDLWFVLCISYSTFAGEFELRIVGVSDRRPWQISLGWERVKKESVWILNIHLTQKPTAMSGLISKCKINLEEMNWFKPSARGYSIKVPRGPVSQQRPEQSKLSK